MNVNLVYAELRPSQTAVVHCNDDGTYTILININKPRDKQIKGVFHELSHIVNDDFFSDLQVGLIEKMAHAVEHNIDVSEINFYYSVL